MAAAGEWPRRADRAGRRADQPQGHGRPEAEPRSLVEIRAPARRRWRRCARQPRRHAPAKAAAVSPQEEPAQEPPRRGGRDLQGAAGVAAARAGGRGAGLSLWISALRSNSLIARPTRRSSSRSGAARRRPGLAVHGPPVEPLQQREDQFRALLSCDPLMMAFPEDSRGTAPPETRRSCARPWRSQPAPPPAVAPPPRFPGQLDQRSRCSSRKSQAEMRANGPPLYAPCAKSAPREILHDFIVIRRVADVAPTRGQATHPAAPGVHTRTSRSEICSPTSTCSATAWKIRAGAVGYPRGDLRRRTRGAALDIERRYICPRDRAKCAGAGAHCRASCKRRLPPARAPAPGPRAGPRASPRRSRFRRSARDEPLADPPPST